MRQNNLVIYNAYEPGLFGLHHNPQDVERINLDPGRYSALKQIFFTLCGRLGERALPRLGASMIVTPEPVGGQLASHIAQRLGVSEYMEPLQPRVNAGELCESVLNDPNLMDRLIKWRDQQSSIPVLTPRTYTPQSIALAQELNIHHAHILPSSDQQIRGIFPSAEYLGTHPAEINNSKVANFVTQQELDRQNGTDFSPAGDVAFSIDHILATCLALARSGKEIMIKADLSVDGMGNLHIDPNQIVNGASFMDLPIQEAKVYLQDKLRERGIPYGGRTGVVVSEFLTEKISDPSVEIYNPPHDSGGEPHIYYRCDMLIENGGFAGSVIPNQGIGVPEELMHEYHQVMQEVEKSILQFAEMRWKDGYVGINDCDIAICLGRNGHLYAKILEYNYNRETGGTASYHLRHSWGGNNHGVLIARDTVQGALFANPLSQILPQLSSIPGVMVLGHRATGDHQGQIMSAVYAEDYNSARTIDAALQEIANG